MRVLVTGATSKTAEAIYSVFSRESNDKIIMVSSSDEISMSYPGALCLKAVISDFDAMNSIIDSEKPDVIINTAAMTNVDLCESRQDEALLVNTYSVENLVNAAQRNDAHFIHISTDYIFDGKNGPYYEDDKVSPLNYYGETKLLSENICRDTYDKISIVRTNQLYGASSFKKTDFVQWVINNLSDNKVIKVVDGQYGNPTYTVDLAAFILKLAENECFGTYNTGGKDLVNRYEFAQLIAEVYAFDSELIKKIRPEELSQPAKRPERSGLITLKAETQLNFRFSSLKNGLSSRKFQTTDFNQRIYSLQNN